MDSHAKRTFCCNPKRDQLLSLYKGTDYLHVKGTSKDNIIWCFSKKDHFGVMLKWTIFMS